MPHSTTTAATLRVCAASLAFMLLATLALVAPRTAQAQDLSFEKYVASVNLVAPTAGELIAVAEGDSVVYGLAVTGPASLGGTNVTVTDVFKTNELSFENASAGGCTEEEAQIVCALTLDDTGATEVLLTFTVLPSEGSSENCQRLVNNATLRGEDGTEATAQAEIETCPAGASEGTLAGSATDDSDAGHAEGEEGAAAGSAPDTALPAGQSPFTGIAVIFGTLLVGAALIASVRPLERVRARR